MKINKKKFRKISKHIKNFQTSIILFLVGMALVGAGLSLTKISKTAKEPEFVSASASEDKTKVKVDIAGAVKKPGVYSLSIDSRILDLIEQAGGFSDNSDKVWISKNLNLASKLSDGQKVYIPFVGESVSFSSQIIGKININTASASDLDTLPDIGQVRAEKIIANRPYSSLEELLSKKVIGASTFEKIKDKITY